MIRSASFSVGPSSTTMLRPASIALVHADAAIAASAAA
jgi:hypothetical protein